MLSFVQQVLTILFVEDLEVSKAFYKNILALEPSLDVPGMVEFTLSESCKIGLMPNQGIYRILENKISHPNLAHGIPRCELYLYVSDIYQAFENATRINWNLLSPIEMRDWGDLACYFKDPDGHIIAFAQRAS